MYKFKYQNNAKRNAILSDIYEDLLENLGEEEVRRYYNEFNGKKLTDYNIAQYGNLLIYYYDIRQFFIARGLTEYGEKFKQPSRQNDYKISDDEVWRFYKRLVGLVVDYMIRRPQDIKKI